MKTREFERRRRMARQYHRNAGGDQFDRGICIRHDYGEVDPAELSWWDDVQFVLGGMRVAVAWQHPRYVYSCMVADAAHAATAHLYDRIEGGLFAKGQTNYRKVGRSRKKAVSYTSPRQPGADEWFAAFLAEEARVRQEASYTVSPSIRVEQLAWCRYVDIVAPIEVRSVAELRKLAELVRRILRQETALACEFPGYIYGKPQWVSEGLADQPAGVLSHRLAGT